MRLSDEEIAKEPRFWSKVDFTGECWLWTACATSNGYGRYADRRFRCRWILAHRRAYALQVGPIPNALTVDHLCRTKLCQRASHMELVSLPENIRRKGLHGVAAVNAAKTHCPRGHALTPDSLRGGQRRRNRSCKRCSTERARERRQQCH